MTTKLGRAGSRWVEWSIVVDRCRMRSRNPRRPTSFAGIGQWRPRLRGAFAASARATHAQMARGASLGNWEGAVADRPNMFHHENLDVYRMSIAFIRECHALVKALPPAEASLREQLRRAAISIPLNIAEGAGRVSQRDRRNFYAIARGSALECAAALDVVVACGLRPVEDVKVHKELLQRVVAMLSRMCRQRESGA